MSSKEVIAMRGFEYSPDGLSVQRLSEGQRFVVRGELLAGLEAAGLVRAAGDKDEGGGDKIEEHERNRDQDEPPAEIPEGLPGDPAQNEEQPILDPDEPTPRSDPPGAVPADVPKTTKARRRSSRVQA